MHTTLPRPPPPCCFIRVITRPRSYYKKQQSAGDIFGRTRPHWPSAPTLTLGGLLGGGGGGRAGGDDYEPWWRQLGSNVTGRRAWMVLGGVFVAVCVAVLLRGGGEKEGAT